MYCIYIKLFCIKKNCDCEQIYFLFCIYVFEIFKDFTFEMHYLFIYKFQKTFQQNKIKLSEEKTLKNLSIEKRRLKNGYENFLRIKPLGFERR